MQCAYVYREYVIRNVIVQAASARPITVSCPYKRTHVHNYNIIIYYTLKSTNRFAHRDSSALVRLRRAGIPRDEGVDRFVRRYELKRTCT